MRDIIRDLHAITRNKTKRREWKVIGLCVLMMLAGHVAVAKSASPLLGTWQSQSADGTVSLVFQSESSLVYDGEQAQYSLVEGAIRLYDEGEVIDYPYVLQGKTLVVAFPEGYQLQFTKVSDKVPSSPQASKNTTSSAGNNADLARQIAGIWWGYANSVERKIGLCPNGVYHDYTESSYSGSSNDSLGNQTMTWGTGSQSGGAGKWSIQGNNQQGVITVQYNDGRRTSIQYRQSKDSGCLLFNGNTLCRSGRCE